jgi:hypothetical protein
MDISEISSDLAGQLPELERALAQLALTEEELAEAMLEAGSLLEVAVAEPRFTLPDTPAGKIAEALVTAIGLGLTEAEGIPDLEGI